MTKQLPDDWLYEHENAEEATDDQAVTCLQDEERYDKDDIIDGYVHEYDGEYFVFVYDWNLKTETYDIPRRMKLARPDQWDIRGGSICAACGGRTRSVLDGESWCDKCGRYQ